MTKQNPIPHSVSNGAAYFAELQTMWKKEYATTSTLFSDSMMVDGHPPMTTNNSELGMWQSLTMMRASNDPRFYTDPEAQAVWAQLNAKYGGPNPSVQFGGA